MEVEQLRQAAAEKLNAIADTMDRWTGTYMPTAGPSHAGQVLIHAYRNKLLANHPSVEAVIAQQIPKSDAGTRVFRHVRSLLSDPREWPLESSYKAEANFIRSLADLIRAAGKHKPGNAAGESEIRKDDSTTDEKATALLAAHSEWTNKQIADKVPCHPKTLNKPNMVKFRLARKALQSGREEYMDDSIPERGPDRRRRPSNINHFNSDD